MKKAWLLLAIVLGACGKEDGGLENELVGLRDRMCACTDAACANKVVEDLSALMARSQDQAKERSPRLEAVAKEMNACQSKVLAAAAPPADAAVAVPADAPAPDAGPPPESKYGYCEIEITGAVEASMRVAFDEKGMGSDYWLSKDEAAAGKARVKAAEKREGLDLGDFQMPFSLKCADGKTASLMLRPSLDSKLKHVKLGPGEYPIDDASKKPGTISSALVVYQLQGAMKPATGTMRITRFEKKGEFEATFELEAAPYMAPEKLVKVTGKAVYHCADYGRCGRGGR